MDSLDAELKELKTFIADLKADRTAQKEKEKRESWTKYTSMSIVFIAVLAAIATQIAAKHSSRTLVELNNSTYFQALATEKWSYYQANSIKLNLYETLHDQAAKAATAPGSEPAKPDDAYAAKVTKYGTLKDQTSKDAKELEDKRDAARANATASSKRGGAMGIAVSIFQISIAMGSICLVVKKRWLWYVSLILAAFGTVKMAMVWFGAH